MSDNKTVSFAEFRAKVRGAAFVRDEERYCQHHHIILDPEHGTIECEDCGKSLSAFVTLSKFVDGWNRIQEWKDKIVADGHEAHKAAQRRLATVYQTTKKYKPHLRAIKAFEKLWRRDMGPCCPHCGNALLPEDFAEGARSTHSRNYEMSLRESRAQQKAPSP